MIMTYSMLFYSIHPVYLMSMNASIRRNAVAVASFQVDDGSQTTGAVLKADDNQKEL